MGRWTISRVRKLSRKFFLGGYPLAGRNGRSVSLPSASVRTDWKLSEARYCATDTERAWLSRPGSFKTLRPAKQRRREEVR